MELVSPRAENAEFGAQRLGSHLDHTAVCEAPRCSAVDGDDSCTACRVWDYALTSLDEDLVSVDIEAGRLDLLTTFPRDVTVVGA